jgi:hypothetical protein
LGANDGVGAARSYRTPVLGVSGGVAGLSACYSETRSRSNSAFREKQFPPPCGGGNKAIVRRDLVERRRVRSRPCAQRLSPRLRYVVPLMDFADAQPFYEPIARAGQSGTRLRSCQRLQLRTQCVDGGFRHHADMRVRQHAVAKLVERRHRGPDHGRKLLA